MLYRVVSFIKELIGLTDPITMLFGCYFSIECFSIDLDTVCISTPNQYKMMMVVAISN